MSSIAFDTHAAATRFRRAGFTDDQVEALVEITRETTALPDVSTLATKADIAKLEMTTKAEIERLELATKAEIARLELATKAEIARLELATKAEVAQLGSQIDARIANSQVQTLTIIISANALVVGVITLLSRLIH